MKKSGRGLNTENGATIPPAQRCSRRERKYGFAMRTTRAVISRIFFLNENGPMNDFEKKSFLIKNVTFLSLAEPFDKYSKKEVV